MTRTDDMKSWTEFSFDQLQCIYGDNINNVQTQTARL